MRPVASGEERSDLWLGACARTVLVSGDGKSRVLGDECHSDLFFSSAIAAVLRESSEREGGVEKGQGREEASSLWLHFPPAGPALCDPRFHRAGPRRWF